MDLHTPEIEGFWLNLDQCQQRRAFMHEQLAALQIDSFYTRVSGVVGNVRQASDRGLKPGEWGAWQGWLMLLERASRSNAAVVHLLEDDTTITDAFLDLVHWLSREGGCFFQNAFVCTDGYVSPRQALLIASKCNDFSAGQSWLCINGGIAIPCLNSILLTPLSARKILDSLRSILCDPGVLKPIDVALASLQVPWLTVAPFATGPCLEFADNGSTRTLLEEDQALSRYGLLLLRVALMSNSQSASLRMGVIELLIRLSERKIVNPY